MKRLITGLLLALFLTFPVAADDEGWEEPSTIGYTLDFEGIPLADVARFVANATSTSYTFSDPGLAEEPIDWFGEADGPEELAELYEAILAEHGITLVREGDSWIYDLALDR